MLCSKATKDMGKGGDDKDDEGGVQRRGQGQRQRRRMEGTSGDFDQSMSSEEYRQEWSLC